MDATQLSAFIHPVNINQDTDPDQSSQVNAQELLNKAILSGGGVYPLRNTVYEVIPLSSHYSGS